MTGKETFFASLRSEWFPNLRSRGFKGNRQRFYRDLGAVIHAIGIQVNKYGGSCCINLGAHPRCLPSSSGTAVVEAKHLRVESCEFRWRLTPPSHTDYWWGYERGIAAHQPYCMEGGKGHTAAERACHLARTYWEAGEPGFQGLTMVEDFVGLIGLDDIEQGWPVSPRYLYTPARAALAMARLHVHLGDEEMARRFAVAALRHLGWATALRAPLEEIAGVA